MNPNVWHELISALPPMLGSTDCNFLSQNLAFISHPAPPAAVYPAATVVTVPPVYPAADLVTGVGPDGQRSMHIVGNAVSTSNALPSTVKKSNPGSSDEHGALAR